GRTGSPDASPRAGAGRTSTYNARPCPKVGSNPARAELTARATPGDERRRPGRSASGAQRAHQRVLVRREAEALVQRSGARVAGRDLELDAHRSLEPGQLAPQQPGHERRRDAAAARRGSDVELVDDAHLTAEL